MHCAKCGSPNPDNASLCSSCGASLTNPYGSPQAAGAVPGGKVSNYLVPAIFLTVCCCPMFGVASTVYAAQANTRLEYGDYVGAQTASNKAKMWFWIALGLGLVWYGLIIGMNILSATMAINRQQGGF